MEANVISLSSEYAVTTVQAEKLLKLQGEILEQVALGVDYQTILDALCKAAEQMVVDAVASIMVYDETGAALKVLAAPSVPDDAVAELNGLVPGKASGSCGTAVYSNEAQYVVNTKTDCRWRDLQTLVQNFSIGACWSCPIKIEQGKAIGSFALSSFEERTPSEFYKQLLDIGAHIAGIILKRQQEEQSHWDLTYYDSLTGLANRSLFTKELSQALEHATAEKHKLAVLVLDLDGFKDINDTQGHDVGDLVLQQVAKTINANSGGADILARLGGDEFALLFEYSDHVSVVEHFVRDILALFSKQVSVLGHEFLLSTSIGVSVFPEDGDTGQVLLRNADTALYAAKKLGRSSAQFYNAGLTHSVKHRVDLTADMREALARDEFVLYYQPQYQQGTNQLSGVEALVRWQHPEKGLIPPDEFIPVAEESGFIKELGLWVFTSACQQCQDWWRSGIPEFSVAVNLSVKQLDADCIQQFESILTRMNFPIRNLEVEVTESLIMQQSSLDELKKLDALGISISMDDFGTGHSSLAQLKHLPISKLKIDRSFVKDLSIDENDKVIAQTIIAMGHSLGLLVVAEGVETAEQQAFLVEQGCDLIQGYLLSRPLPAEQLRKLFLKP